MSFTPRNNWKTVTITLTEACNLNCIYCYETNKTAKKTQWETVKKIIDQEFNILDPFEGIYLDFFGGEPFIEFDLIKQAVGYIRNCNFSKPYFLFVTTNGTLVHGEIQHWLKENRDIFSCGLSLDGNKLMQDTNRCNSFDKIDLDFFAQLYPDQPIKMTVSKETLPHLYDGVVFCHEHGFKVSCNLAFGIDWRNPNNASLLSSQLTKLIDFYLVNTHLEPCSMLNVDLSPIAYEEESETTRKWCGAGTHMHTYDVDGIMYPCQFFTPLSAKEKAAPTGTLEFHANIPNHLLDEKCQKCVARLACPTCYGSNYVTTGNLYSKDDSYCHLMKIIIRANSYFQALKLREGKMNLSVAEEQALIRSIVKIQENL